MAVPTIDVANLRRQLDEVEVVESIYSGEGEFEWPGSELDNISMLKGLLQSLEDANLTRDDEGSNSVLANPDCRDISFVIHLRPVPGRDIGIRFCLPRGYPAMEAVSVTVECKGSVTRQQHNLLNTEARKMALELLGAESTLEVVQRVIAIARDMEDVRSGDDVPSGGQSRSGAPTSSSRTSGSEVTVTAAGSGSGSESSAATRSIVIIMRCVIWFHHIKSIEKRKRIIEWGRELRLGGYCKPGFPGVIICEGEQGDVKEFIERLQRLRWQAMSVREEEKEEGREGQVSDHLRKFRRVSLSELPETGMSELAGFCREIGLERLFLTALKIYR